MAEERSGRFHHMARAVLLTLVAGIADAVGYLTMGGIFAANMTGNTVLAGIALAEGDAMRAFHRFAPLVLFFCGAMCARLLLRITGGSRAPLALHALVLFIAAFLDADVSIAISVVAFAMGLQASAVTRFGQTSTSTVVVTGTMARLADAVVDRFGPPSTAVSPPAGDQMFLVMTWASYLVGAAVGVLLLTAMSKPLLVPAVLALIVVFL